MSAFAGDEVILMALYEYRLLSSGQLARLTGRSQQVVRRAIRKRLRPEKLVADIRRHVSEEAAYTLGVEGLKYVARVLRVDADELFRANRVMGERTLFFRHSILVSEIRLAFNLAASTELSPVSISRTIGEWETVPGIRGEAPHHERFILSEKLVGPDGVARHHRPDSLFLMHPKAEGPSQTVAVFVEADRNSEPMKRISAKFHAFWLYWRERLFAKSFGAVAMRVLFILDNVKDEKRIGSMQKELTEFLSRLNEPQKADAFRRCFRFACMRDLSEHTVLQKPIWFDADNHARLFFQTPAKAGNAHNVTKSAEVSA